jgi:RNA polymerase subunit RPABC4/transcription elongation factor Spt4
MGTFPCPTCHRMLSKTARSCPQCGHDFTDGTKTTATIGGYIIAIIFAIGWFSAFAGSMHYAQDAAGRLTIGLFAFSVPIFVAASILSYTLRKLR